MFECLKDSYSFRSVITPAKWSSKYWTYGFGEALNCYNDTGYDKISFQEHERAKDVFLKEAKKIYEECGRGWVSNPFQRLRNN